MLQALHKVRSQCRVISSLMFRVMTHLILVDVREALQSTVSGRCKHAPHNSGTCQACAVLTVCATLEHATARYVSAILTGLRYPRRTCATELTLTEYLPVCLLSCCERAAMVKGG